MANNIFHGVPWDHSASVGFDNDPTITYFFRMNPTTNLNEVFIHDELSNTTTVSDIGIPTMFPDLPTNIPIIHGSENQPSNIGEHLIYWMDNALSPPLQFIVTTSPTAVPVYIGSTNPNNVYHTGSSVEQISTGTQWYVVFGWDFFYAARGSISHLLYTGNYGGVGQPYGPNGSFSLPYTGGGAQVETAYCSILRVTGQDNQVYLFTPTGDAIILDLLAQQISSVIPYGPIASAPSSVDDKYWDLVDSAVAKLGTTIKPDFEILDFTPNIIAGNYPQSGTAKGPPQGAAWYLAGTWSEWTQTTANVWAPNGNTIQFTSNAVNPGLDTNGAGWIGTLGGVAMTGTWSPTPFTWHVLTGNIFNMTHTNGAPINFSPLVNLPQPNNFTPAQAESGMFSISNVGTMATSVLISNSVSPFKSPIFPVEIDLTFLSETQVIMRRSWEIIDTTYTITSGNVLSGQYISPTYPNDNNTASHLPDSYTKATPWVVLAENNTEFEILFSGGLNNRIPADVSGTYTMTVTPTPANTALTFAWTANYYTAGDVLISAVAGIGTTGLVSSFTVGGASLPVNCGYVLYGCTSSENIDAFASLVIIQPPTVPVVPFILTFQAPNNQISSDGIYSVSPLPVDPTTTYAYTAVFRSISGVSLGAVPGAGASGTSSAFSIVYANLPATTAYIDYNATATGGAQGGETSQLSITIIEPCPPCPPIPDPDDIYGTVVSESAANIIQSNNSVDASHKRIDVKKLDNITLELTDIDGNIKYCSSNIYYELEFKINKVNDF